MIRPYFVTVWNWLEQFIIHMVQQFIRFLDDNNDAYRRVMQGPIWVTYILSGLIVVLAAWYCHYLRLRARIPNRRQEENNVPPRSAPAATSSSLEPSSSSPKF